MLLAVFFAAAPARARGLYALPALGTATFILLLAALGAALL
ncbi:hypothetical protein ACFWP3_26370 [Streptomyces sp. NPDC058525]